MPGLTVASFLFHRIGEDGIPEYYEYWALGSLDLKKWFCDPTGHVIQPFHAAGMTSGSDFSRYARSPKPAQRYILATIACLFCTGTLVSFVGLVITAAAQKLHGAIYWNTPDLLLRMMHDEDGTVGSAKAKKIKLSRLYQLRGYFFHHVVNRRAIPVWIAGWAPTVGGLNRTVEDDLLAPKPLFYLDFSFLSSYVVNFIFPPSNVEQVNDTDVFGTFTTDEARRMCMAPSLSTPDSGSLGEKDEKTGSDIESVMQLPAART
uniref:Uncharacterized protein n=1 Tax=Moniliophthora roreri TaxID=221103 RepID=A0A0W0EXM5_MONRR